MAALTSETIESTSVHYYTDRYVVVQCDLPAVLRQKLPERIPLAGGIVPDQIDVGIDAALPAGDDVGQRKRSFLRTVAMQIVLRGFVRQGSLLVRQPCVAACSAT